MDRKRVPFFLIYTLLTLVGFWPTSYAQGLHYDDDAYLPENMTLEETLEGMVFADEEGLTLYTFDKDINGISNCYGECARNWTPLYSEKKLVGKYFSTVFRKDGRLQMRYKNQPLYLWKDDDFPGDMEGNRRKGMWHILFAPALAPQ